MKKVSQGFKDTMNQAIRPTSQFEARLEIVDRGVETGSTVTEQRKEDFATSVFDETHECDYLTFEKNLFCVGEDFLIPPESDYLPNGFVSDVLTNANGVFETPPCIEFAFAEAKDFVGITYSFVKDAPKAIRVTTYLSGAPVDQFITSPNGLEYADEKHQILPCDRMQFEFLSMNEPYRRLRISRMRFGLIKIYNNSNIVSTNHIAYTDPVSASLPYNKLQMSIANMDKNYNPDNPHGIWRYIKNGHPLQVRYGTTVQGKIEWVDAARLYLNDAPRVDGTTAIFEAYDPISRLTGTYHKGVWRSEGISLYDLAVEVLTEAGVEDWELSTFLKSVITHAPLPAVTFRECLQLIANAGRCVLYCDVSGKIVMKTQLYPTVTVDDNGHMPWGAAKQAYEQAPPFSYISFEPNKWMVDTEEAIILPENEADRKPVGFVSQAMSDEQGVFAEPPVITLKYSLPVSSYNYSLVFDSVTQTYAKDFNLTFSNEDGVVHEEQVRGNTSVEYALPVEIINYTQVVITLLTTNAPRHRVHIENINGGRVTDYYLDFSVAMEKPVVIKTEELKSVDAVAHMYSVADELSDIYQVRDMYIGGEKEVQISYEAATGVSAEIVGGELVSAVYYAKTAFLTIRADDTVDIKLTGYALVDKQVTVSVPVNKTGEICPLDNPLITDTTTAQNVGEWVASYYSNRNTYEMRFRQDFRLDANDMIYIRSEFEEMIPARITKLQYKLPGQTGAISVRRLM